MINGAQEVFEWIEVDQDACELVFGSTQCGASLLANGDQECFNTRQTCAKAESYIRGVLTLKFCANQAFLPDGGNWLPFLSDVSISGSSINPIGADSSSRALGTRGGLTVTIQDAPYSDRVTDPYVDNRIARIPTYDPEQLGSFWTKWRARNPFYMGRPIRYKSALIEDGQLTEIETRYFFITGFAGPTSDGKVRLTARDIFSVYADKNIQIPPANSGKLLNDITDSDPTFTLDPVGIGNEQYAASGWMTIGDEIFAFTRSGDVVTKGAQYGSSVAESHSAGDVVQQCLFIDGKNVSECMEIVVKDTAQIPVQYLDLVQWSEEQTAYLPRVYTRMIAVPEGLETCLSSMSLSMYFYPLWDDRNQLMKIRAVRPAQDDFIYDVSDEKWVEMNTGEVADMADQLYTQVHVYYAQRNPLAAQDDPTNYSGREIFFTDGGSADQYGTDTIKSIYASWIPSEAAAAAVDLGEKFTSRYSTMPRRYQFVVPARGFPDMWVGDFLRADAWQNTDEFGARIPLNLQILSAQVSRARDQYKFSAQEFAFEKPIDPNEKSLIIGLDYFNLNLYDYFVDNYGVPPEADDRIRVTLRAGVVIGSVSTGLYSFTVDSRFPVGCQISIDWLGIGAGAGGGGGNAATIVDSSNPFGMGVGGPGQDGGPCWLIEFPVSVNNMGTIGGGGGGGGAGANAVGTNNVGGFAASTGGGGGGGGGVYAGIFGSGAGAIFDPDTPSVPGNSGSIMIGGAGGDPPLHVHGSWQARGGIGGAGGGLGQDGTAGSGIRIGNRTGILGAGGLAGESVVGTSLVTWIFKGDVRGPEVA